MDTGEHKESGADAAPAPAPPVPPAAPFQPPPPPAVALSNLTDERLQQVLDRRLVGPKLESKREERTYGRQRAQVKELDAPAAPRVPDPARSDIIRRGWATRRRNALSAPVDGRKMPRDLDLYECDIKAMAEAMDEMVLRPEVELQIQRPPPRPRPANVDGHAEVRPGLTTSFKDAMGPDFNPEADQLPWWFEWAADVTDEAVHAKLVKFLLICKRWDIRPFQPFWGLAPSRWRNKVVRELCGDNGARAAAEILAFSKECYAAAAASERDQGRPKPASCEMCAMLSDEGQKILKRAFEYRGVVKRKLGLDGDSDDDDDGDDEAGGETHTVHSSRGDEVGVSAEIDACSRAVHHMSLTRRNSTSTTSSSRPSSRTGNAPTATATCRPSSTSCPPTRSSPTSSASSKWARRSRAA